jgi:hypothetical protein
MEIGHSEVHLYKCPFCDKERKASEVAESLPVEILQRVTARRNVSLRKRRSVAGGRPILARCPGCDLKMTAVDLREHRLPCVRERLEKLKGIGRRALLTPKDPDPHPNFSIDMVSHDTVIFHKLSSSQRLTVELQKIAEITDDGQALVRIRVLGEVRWNDNVSAWEFLPTRIGRPSAVAFHAVSKSSQAT